MGTAVHSGIDHGSTRRMCASTGDGEFSANSLPKLATLWPVLRSEWRKKALLFPFVVERQFETRT